MPPASKSGPPEPWTRALRKRVHGSSRAHRFDAPETKPSLEEAWKALRDFADRAAGARRVYEGDAAWTARCRLVDEELQAQDPPARLDADVEVAREIALRGMEVHLSSSGAVAPVTTNAPIASALAALRVRVGGAAFVADYLTRATGVMSSSRFESGQYSLSFKAVPPGGSCEEPLSVDPEHLAYAAVRRQLFAAPEADFAQGAALLADRCRASRTARSRRRSWSAG